MIRLPMLVRAVMLDHLAGGMPEEACGLLIGDRESRTATRFWACRNVADRPASRFELHPEDTLAAMRAAAVTGEALIGVVHSHPTRGAHPTEADVAGHPGDGMDAVIVSMAAEVPLVRAWEIGAGRLVETLVVAG